MKIAIALMIFIFLLTLGAWAYEAVQSECHTDTECMALCPPADLTCDGGPDVHLR